MPILILYHVTRDQHVEAWTKWPEFCRKLFEIHLISLHENIRILTQIALNFIVQGQKDNKSSLVRVMAWHWTGEKSLPEPISLLTHVCTIRSQCVNTSRPRQNGRHFPDDIFKYIFLNENVWISLKVSLKFVPKIPINNISVLVQIMVWRRPGDEPLSESMMVSLLTHICVCRP